MLPNLSFDTVVVLSERAAQHIRQLNRPWQVVDEMVRVSDRVSFNTARRLAHST